MAAPRWENPPPLVAAGAVVVCPACAALVPDTDLDRLRHQDWHDHHPQDTS